MENPNIHLNLYRFFWDCGRAGDLESYFVASPEEVKKAIGKEVYFGEVLGKHSEIYGTLEEDDFDIVSEEQDKVIWFDQTIGYTGRNPLEYVQQIDEEEE